MKSTLLVLSLSTLASSLTLPRFLSAPPHHPNQATMTTTTQSLSDLLPLLRSVSIFASLTRDVPRVAHLLSSTSTSDDEGAKNITLLAPTNAAMHALPRKPWESPADYDALGTQAYAGDDGQDRATENLARFVGAHVVPSPWAEGEKVRTVAGGEVWWETDGEGTRRVMPGRVEVVEIGKRAQNGEVWVLKGALNYA